MTKEMVPISLLTAERERADAEKKEADKWFDHAGELGRQRDAAHARIAVLTEALKPFAEVAGFINDDYPDGHTMTVQCDCRRDVVEAMQKDWDQQKAEGKQPLYKRPSDMNWPKEVVALDSIKAGHFRAARKALTEST